MAKYAGLVTYVTQAETKPGVWTSQTNSRFMKGDVLRLSSNFQNDGKVNTDVSLNHRVSLVADEYALGNYYDIKYLEMDGRKWKVASIEVVHPRIMLTLGGVWNGK